MSSVIKPELLSPAGNMESVRAAVNNGCDAVYIGGKNFSARAYAGNFDIDEIEQVCDYCHLRNVKVYAAVNTIYKNEELKSLLSYVSSLSRIGVDALIMQDLGAAKALTLLALPAEEREQFVEDHNVIDMSARQLKEAIRERDEARKAAKVAKADASAAEQARAKMEEDMAVTQNLLESARAEADSAGSRARALEEKLRMLQEKPVEVAVETVVDPEAIEKAKAEAVAEMRAKLDEAREAKNRAETKAKNAEEALEQVRIQLEEQAKTEKKDAQNPAPAPEWLPLQWIAGSERPVRLLRAVCKFDLGEGDRDHVRIARWDGTGWTFLSGAQIDAPCVSWWPIPED